MKPKLISDEKTRRIWQTCLEARRLVESWPAWKRSEDVQGARAPLTDEQPDAPADR